MAPRTARPHAAARALHGHASWNFACGLAPASPRSERGCGKHDRGGRAHATRHPEHPRAPRTSAEAREQLTPLARRGASAARIDAQDMLQPCHTRGTRRGARSTDPRPDLTRLHARGARGPLVARWRAGERGGRAESGVPEALRSSIVVHDQPAGGSRALSLEPRPADRARRDLMCGALVRRGAIIRAVSGVRDPSSLAIGTMLSMPALLVLLDLGPARRALFPPSTRFRCRSRATPHCDH